ncbi:MAG: hypothetical protein ACI85K_002619, partial [Hyphomicrobiaceae bacterium]
MGRFVVLWSVVQVALRARDAPDGSGAAAAVAGGVEWCQHEQVTDADVALLVRRVRDRVRRKLRKMGKWPED